MKIALKRLILWYLLFVVIKSVFSYFILSPSAFSDEYIYLKMARSFFYSLDFSVHGILTTHFPPVYPMIISLSYLFKDSTLVYLTIKIINAIISSLIIFPAYFLSREFTSTKKSMLIAILISLLPSSFSFTGYIMSENLFYPMFLFSILFFYKTISQDKLIWPILTGIFFGLTFMTKYSGLALVIMVFIIYFFRLIFRIRINLNIKNILLILSIFLIMLSPWIIRNINISGASLGGLGGYYGSRVLEQEFENHFNIFIFLIKFVLNLGLLILGSYIFFAINAFSFLKNKSNFKASVIFTTTIFLILIGATYHGLYSNLLEFNWITGRPIGRYVDTILPLVFIMGLVSLKEKNSRMLIILPILIFSSLLILFPLFPVNNLSYSWLGVIKSGLDYIFHPSLILSLIIFSIFIIILYLISLRIQKLSFNKVITVFLIIFVLINILNFGITYYNSKVFWYEGEQMQLALKFNEKNKGTSDILFDIESCTTHILKLDQSSICDPSGSSTIMGTWMNNNIKIGNVSQLRSENIIISKRRLDYPIYLRSDSIFIYGVDNG